MELKDLRNRRLLRGRRGHSGLRGRRGHSGLRGRRHSGGKDESTNTPRAVQTVMPPERPRKMSFHLTCTLLSSAVLNSESTRAAATPLPVADTICYPPCPQSPHEAQAAQNSLSEFITRSW